MGTPNEHTADAIAAYQAAQERILYYLGSGWITEGAARHFADRLTEAAVAFGAVPEETEFEAAEDGKPAGLPEI